MNEARHRIIQRAIVEHDIRVHREEIDRARAVFAADLGLENDAEIDRWLREHELTRAELDDQLRQIIAFGKLKGLVVGDRAERSLPAGADRDARAEMHCRIFEQWLDEQS